MASTKAVGPGHGVQEMGEGSKAPAPAPEPATAAAATAANGSNCPVLEIRFLVGTEEMMSTSKGKRQLELVSTWLRQSEIINVRGVQQDDVLCDQAVHPSDM